MMTIKEFANLCKCSTQTLRYYDKIDLLKPLKVDPWSGYRYYTESQAIDFVKVKNLQAADFSIHEIKTLLSASDQQVYQAFDRKIMEQAQKLERIKQIQQSYLTEKRDMETLIQRLADFLTDQLTDFDILREFGSTPEDVPSVVARIKSFINERVQRHLPAESNVTLIVNDQVIHGADRVADAIHLLNRNNLDDPILLDDKRVSENGGGFSPDQWETLWECQGWSYVYEFIDGIPQLENGKDYCFFFLLTEEKYSDGIAFPMFMLSTMLPRVSSDTISMGCSIEKSTDGQNYFALMYRK